MAGIAAVVTGGDTPSRLVRTMSRTLQRNPHDASAVWCKKDFGLAVCWSKAECDKQPWLRRGGHLAGLFDGYLADPSTLASKLAMPIVSDGDLVLRAYERWGGDCVEHLDGEFAFIVIDAGEGLLFAARDIQGQRPLYYRKTKGGIVLASDVATLIGAGETPSPNRFFLAQIAAAQIVTPDETAWHGILRVPPASSIVFRNERIAVRRYYQPPLEVARLKRSDADLFEEYRTTLAGAVQSATRSEYAVAFEVSGGLDSSSLFALATRGASAAPAIRAHSLRGVPGSRADEIAFARLVADRCGHSLAEHPLFHPPLDWFGRQAKAEQDLPQYPNGAMSMEMEAAIVEESCHVAVNGNGGDQWLDGSRAYVVQNLRALQFGRLIENLRNSSAHDGRYDALGAAIRQTVLAVLPDALRDRLRMMTARRRIDAVAVPWLSSEFAERIAELWLDRQRLLPTEPVARAKLATFHSTWSQFASDMMSRQHKACGLEGRSPMLGRRFIEFCCSLPEDAKLRGATNRYIHREAMRGLLPEQVRLRRTKATFPVLIHPQEVAAYFNRHKIGVLDAIVDVDAALRVLEDENERSRNAFASWGLFMVRAFLLENEPESG